LTGRGIGGVALSPILAAVSSPAASSGTGLVGKVVRTTLGLVVVAASAGVATHAMGLWQLDGPTDPPVQVRPVAEAVKTSGRTVTVLGAGSILPAPEIWDQARRDGRGGTLDFAPMMAGARKTVSAADLALCHLSAPLAAAGGPYSGPPRYNVPAEVAQGIAATGFDGCATAAEHAFDQGLAGVTRTLDALDRAKVGHAGTYRGKDQAKKPKIYPAGGVKVAHLSYSLALGAKVPPAQKSAVARPTAARIASDAENAREAGATIVVVSVDWGTDAEHEPDVDQQNLARAVASMRDVDIVFGHGAHVAQPVERIGDKWIIYGLGDFGARQAQPVNDNREGSMMRVTFSPAGDKGRWKVASIEALPTFIDLNPNIRLVDLEQALADPGVPAGRRTIYEAAVEHVESHLRTRVGTESLLHVRATGR
jgi:hypothetical protein